MSWMPYGTATVEDRDQVAEDRDEAAWRRDRASAARDKDADERDRYAQDRMQEVMQYTALIRRLLDATGQPGGQKPSADQPAARGLLRHLEEVLQDADAGRWAAASDRRAAAADRQQAAEDRFIKAAHRDQAAIERAQLPAGLARADDARGRELFASADSARARAQALCQQMHDLEETTPSARDLLRHSELARLRAQLDTMPTIEQAKGIIMAQARCGEAEAFILLRQASQRLNEPVRDLAAHVVADMTIKRQSPAG